MIPTLTRPGVIFALPRNFACSEQEFGLDLWRMSGDMRLSRCFQAAGENGMATRRDWPAIIDRLNRSSKGAIWIRMGSPGSAQVTRCRLLEQWKGIEVRTAGAILHLELVQR